MARLPLPPSFPAPDPGLCRTCRHAQVVETRRGSRFYLCGRSKTDPSFPRYPNLPVLACPGYAVRIIGGFPATSDPSGKETT